MSAQTQKGERRMHATSIAPRAVARIGGVLYLIVIAAGLFTVAERLFPTILLRAFVAELSLALWLLLMGVDVGRFEATS